jgi:hypothetical protein
VRIPGESRLQVLGEVDLVDVAARDRRSDLVDGGAVLRRRPRLLPLADLEAAPLVRRADMSNPARGERQRRARLGRRWSGCPPDPLGEPVSQVELCDELRSVGEELVIAKPALDAAERGTRIS